MINQQDVWALLCLNATEGLSLQQIDALIKGYGSASAAVTQGPEQWEKDGVLPEGDFHALRSIWDGARSVAEWDFKEVNKKGYQILPFHLPGYPFLLKQIHAPPPIIYMAGDPSNLEAPAVAIVGSRRCTYYGERVARELAQGLASHGIKTVSGLAKGVDRVVHESTLEAGGETWGVLGSGLANLYPHEHAALARRMEKNGAVISEFPLTMKPYPGNFPRRNRIIAGLSLMTIVVEGTQRSGSLITARLALQEGRDVLAVPGPIYSRNSGAPHYLIKMGAKMVTCLEDILDELPDHLRDQKKYFVDEKEGAPENQCFQSKMILDMLGATAVPKEWLAQKVSLPVEELSRLILDLEMQGKVQSLPGGLLVRKN